MYLYCISLLYLQCMCMLGEADCVPSIICHYSVLRVIHNNIWYGTTISIIYELASTANWECVVSDLIDCLVELNASLQGIYNLIAYISNFCYCTCI